MRILVVCLALLLAGCTDASAPGASTPTGPVPESRPSTPSTPGSRSRSATPAPPRPWVRPGHLDVALAERAVQHLAGDIGPRHATSAAFGRAAAWVAAELDRLGYEVRRQRVDVPGGLSWGVPVAAGRSTNVVAAPRRFDPTRPHLVVGAHLDTVPQAPGAEDNASGVGVLLSVAQAVAGRRTRLPVVLVAFGAEEPRGPGDDDHHYGSRHYVAQLSRAERSAVRGLVSLDRVGVGDRLPVCSAGPADRQRARLLAAARAAAARVVACEDNRASDHWSFVRSGLPGTRLGSTPYAGYHSAADRPAVVARAQLGRAGRTVLAWLGELT